MKPAIFLLISLTTLTFINSARAESTTYSSTDTRTTLLELYTSEGCSSCPPAERWLSQLKHDPRLWKTLFPVALHVDYWDYLGWKDVFSDARYSDRQQTYASYGYASTVYTPGFFQNGREWRSWFFRRSIQPDDTIKTGTLSATITPQKIEAQFKPAPGINATRLNIAILGFNKTTRIRAGENAGKNLTHDFVALALHQYASDDNRWNVTDQALLSRLKQGSAIVLWVTRDRDPTPIQTTGGWITKK
jgi:hypothetical protein